MIKMKILFFDDAHTFGGAQIAAVNMAKYMKQEMGLDVCFTCPASNKRLISRLSQVDGIEVKSDGYSAIPFFLVTHFLFLWRIPSIIKKMRAARGDIVIINMAGLEFGWLYIYAAKILKIKKIYWLHNVFLYTDLMQREGARHIMDVMRDSLANIFSKFIIHDLVTVSSSARISLLQRVGLKNGIKVLGNTISLPEINMAMQKNLTRSILNGYAAETIAVVPGRISFGDKGQDRLVASLPELESHNIAIIFIGDGHDLEKLRKLCAGHANVFFVGWQDSVAAYMQDADVILLPSRCETQGLIAMEAMYLQTPVLVSNIPAFVELVGEEFVVDFEASMQLCEKIKWVCRLDKMQLTKEYSDRLEVCCGNEYKNHIGHILREATV
jgi:glycosyltransferase involved in cell wall biosynthesis